MFFLNMNREKVFYALTVKTFILGWGMVLAYVALNSFGALALKNQVQKLGPWSFTSAKSVFSYFFLLFSSWKTWAAVGAICAATGAWIMALGHLELSKAYPVAIGLNLVITVAAAFFIFNEPLTLQKIAGVVLIMAGALILFR
jgi:multidrug transporter EmrE-like cation transporter